MRTACERRGEGSIGYGDVTSTKGVLGSSVNGLACLYGALKSDSAWSLEDRMDREVLGLRSIDLILLLPTHNVSSGVITNAERYT